MLEFDGGIVIFLFLFSKFVINQSLASIKFWKNEKRD